MKKKLLIITPVKHISNVFQDLNKYFNVKYLPDPYEDDVLNIIGQFDCIFTNPNKSKIFLGPKILASASNLKVICTASTGVNHIDIEYIKGKNIKLISLTEEREIINSISSTAEHAFALTLSSLRNIPNSFSDVKNGNWDYEKFIGRQVDKLTFGIIGYGRLGKLYSAYCLAFGAKVIVYDPYKNIENKFIKQVSDIESLLQDSDVLSFHVHVTDETIKMVNKTWFDKIKRDVLIVNTSRGDIISEHDLVKFLKNNNKAKIATDVLEDEVRNRSKSPLLKFASKNSDRIIITPHIGGMTKEAQEIAYGHSVSLLINYMKEN